jgi:flagellar basal-body rod protein FlgG
MSIGGMNVASTGLTAYSQQLAVVGNNLANINTNAFKENDIRFQDMLYATPTLPGKPNGLTATGLGVQFGYGVGVASNPTLFKQGPLNPGQELDIAINGEGFFQVVDSNGNAFLTRLGSFQPKGIGSSGLMNLQIAGDTYTLEPPIDLPGENAATTVSPMGVVQQGTFSAQIQLVRVSNPDGLAQVGNLLFKETPASGAQLTGTPGNEGFGTIADNTLEGSNVDITSSFIDLIGASQNFSLNSQAFVTGNEEVLRAIALAQQA